MNSYLEKPICIHFERNIGFGNVFKSLITCLAIHPDVKIQCLPEYMYGCYDTIFPRDRIAQKDQDYHNYTGWRLRILATEQDQGHIPVFFNNHIEVPEDPDLQSFFRYDVAIDNFQNPDWISPSVKTRILNTISKIEYLPVIHEYVNQFDRYFQLDYTKTLSLSVRTWCAPHEQHFNIKRPYQFDQYFHQIYRLLITRDVQYIILSCDNHTVSRDYIDFFEYLNIPVIYLENTNLNALQYTVCKMLILSKSRYLIADPISSYTESIYWSSGCQIEYWPVKY